MGIGIDVRLPNSAKMNTGQIRRYSIYALCFIVAVVFACTTPIVAQADSEDLMDLFQTSAFTGSWEVFSKVNFIGMISNYAISFFCLFGLFLTVWRFTITLLYKSSESLFDRVYDLKAAGQSSGKFFGVPGMAKELFNGNFGVGADVFIGFILMLCPNVKAYSDYNPEKMAYNLREDDTITTYVLKMSLPTIMTLFFFTIGFDGTLWQAYGNCVSALSTVAKRAVEVNLSGYVNKALNAGSYYSFSFNTSDPLGKLQKNIATSVYNKLLLNMESYDSATMQSVGSKVEEFVAEYFDATKLDSAFNQSEDAKKISDDTSAANNLSFTSVLNSTKDTGVTGSSYYAVTVNCERFGLSAGDTVKYVHVFVNKKANADETDYFAVKKTSSSTSSSSTETSLSDD